MIDLPAPQAATRLAALLQSPESKTLDFKRLGSGKVAKMLETVCAFANTDGGWLVVGVADPKDAPAGSPAQQRLWGVQENPEAFDELQRKCRTQFNPPISTLTFYRLPRQHHKHMKSTNMLERLNEEIKRGTRVVRIFPNPVSCLRLVRARCAEDHETWLEDHRYLNMDLLKVQKNEFVQLAA